ncbi:MAG: hypothetical protein GY870_08045, partial [archaeon]|nr:hypothetical protein [archaeon]
MAPFSESELQEMKELFIEDGYENLHLMEEQIQILEKDPKDNVALVDFYRINHSFKGMAGTTGLVVFEKFFHNYETLISAIQDKKVQINKEIIDLFFTTLDVIEENLGLVKKNKPCNDRFESLSKKFEEIISTNSNDEDSKTKSRMKQMFEQSGLEEFNPESMNYDDPSKINYNITVILNDKIKLKLARTLVIIKKVVEFGEIAQTIPSLPDLLTGKIDDRINLIYQSKEPLEEIQRIITNCGEIKEVKISEMNGDEVREELNLEKEKKKEIQEQRDVESSTEVNSVKVSLDLLDKVVELYGELLISSKQLEKKLDEFERPDIKEVLFQMQTYMFDLQDVVMQMQLVPISSVFRIFPRMVRNLAKQSNKSVNFVIKDHDVKVDRKILADIGDITNHILRNGIDHGIESPKERKNNKKPEKANILVETKIQNNLLVMDIKDDGRGIDPEKIAKKAIEKGLYTEGEINSMSKDEIINLIFLSDFSTASKVTNISGRGLGLNIVKEKLLNLGGSVSLETMISEGTNFKIVLPISRLLIKAILVRSAEQIFSIALEDIERLYEVSMADVLVSDGEYHVPIAGENEMIQVHNLGELFNFIDIGSSQNEKMLRIVHVKKGEKSFGLIVDEFLKESEIVIKQI